MSDQTTKQTKVGDDLVWGAEAIADELNLTVGQVYNLIRGKRIPIIKLSTKTIIASKRQLRRALTPTE